MPTCFVIMGFGQKTDLATGRVLDLDKSYRNIIKPAVTAAGYDCIRADEIQHSGVIDVPMYEMLFSADLVVADLSTANLNAIFELGVRVTLRPSATIVIAESRFNIPFDASHFVVRHYEHLGPDIEFDEVMRMRSVLTTLANALKDRTAVDSPVYTMLPDLEFRRSATAKGFAGSAVQLSPDEGDTYASQLQFARLAIDDGSFEFARKILREIYREQTVPGADGKPKAPRPVIVQLLALATYRAGEATAKTDGPEQALAGYAEAEALLRQLDVETTTDPETLGLWSAIHKRRAEIATRSPDERLQDLSEGIRAAERGFIIKRDYYNGTNLAYLLNVRASISSDDDRIADNVLADRVRREVVDITARALATLEKRKSASGQTPLEGENYWLAATHAESLIALGDSSGDDLLQKAIANAPNQWMSDSTKSQLDRLRRLLATAHSAKRSEKKRFRVEKKRVQAEKKQFYVSYAWADQTDPDREKIVDQLCEEAEKQGVSIVRDKTTLRVGDLISDFMQQIGESDRVFVFLSDKYLHSPYCMYELFELWRNSKQNKSDFIRKVRLFTLDSARIKTEIEWLDYTGYWVDERDKLERSVDRVGWKNAGAEVIGRYTRMQTFAGKIADVLAYFADVVRPRTFDEFIKFGFEDPPAVPRPN